MTSSYSSSPLYTEIDSHVASLRERASMLRTVFAVAREPDLPRRARRILRRRILLYVLKPRARAAYYVSSKELS